MLRPIRAAEPPADPGTRAIAQCLGSQNGRDGRDHWYSIFLWWREHNLETLKPRCCIVAARSEFITLGDVETRLCETGLCDKSLGCLVIWIPFSAVNPLPTRITRANPARTLAMEHLPWFFSLKPSVCGCGIPQFETTPHDMFVNVGYISYIYIYNSMIYYVSRKISSLFLAIVGFTPQYCCNIYPWAVQCVGAIFRPWPWLKMLDLKRPRCRTCWKHRKPSLLLA